MRQISFEKLSPGGFTLIELLVTMGIVVVITTVAAVNLGNIRIQARDAVRMTDLQNIAKALDVWFVDAAAFPPEALCTDSSVGCSGCGCAVPNFPNGTGWDANSDLHDLTGGGFLNKVPIDPINNTTFYYRYEPAGTGQSGGGCHPGKVAAANTGCFSICARLEVNPGQWWCILRNGNTTPP